MVGALYKVVETDMLQEHNKIMSSPASHPHVCCLLSRNFYRAIFWAAETKIYYHINISPSKAETMLRL